MRRRSFKVTTLMYDKELIKNVRKSFEHTLQKVYPDTKIKVTYLRKSPWWKFWKRS